MSKAVSLGCYLLAVASIVLTRPVMYDPGTTLVDVLVLSVALGNAAVWLSPRAAVFARAGCLLTVALATLTLVLTLTECEECAEHVQLRFDELFGTNLGDTLGRSFFDYLSFGAFVVMTIGSGLLLWKGLAPRLRKA